MNHYVSMYSDSIHTTKGRVVSTPSLLEYIDCLLSCEPYLRFRVVLYVPSLYTDIRQIARVQHASLGRRF